jgi:hypothetical protein
MSLVLGTAANARFGDTIALGDIVRLVLADEPLMLGLLLDIRQFVLTRLDALLVLIFYPLGAIGDSGHEHPRCKADATRSAHGCRLQPEYAHALPPVVQQVGHRLVEGDDGVPVRSGLELVDVGPQQSHVAGSQP